MFGCIVYVSLPPKKNAKRFWKFMNCCPWKDKNINKSGIVIDVRIMLAKAHELLPRVA